MWRLAINIISAIVVADIIYNFSKTYNFDARKFIKKVDSYFYKKIVSILKEFLPEKVETNFLKKMIKNMGKQ